MWVWEVLGEGTEAPHPLPHMLSYAHLSAVPGLHPFIINWCLVSKMFLSSASRSSKFVEMGSKSWESLIYNQSVRSTASNLGL